MKNFCFIASVTTFVGVWMALIAYSPSVVADAPITAQQLVGKRSRLFVNQVNMTATLGDKQRKLQTVVDKKEKPLQTFFLPLPEDVLFTEMFYHINPKDARPGVETMLSISISTDLTVVWYDEWEDGYDDNVAISTSATTKIWGDGNADNGCAPGIQVCTHANDRLYAGDVIVIQNYVELPRSKNDIRYDGGDRIQASFPVAMTRAAYPEKPGSLMAGAVEVIDTSLWGTEFMAPVGCDMGATFQAFELTAFFVMAAEDRTQVTLPTGALITLNKGEGSYVKVNIGDKLSSNKPIQTDLITGDLNSEYEMRWFSMLPVNQFSSKYVSPLGDSFGYARILMYNPNPYSIWVATWRRVDGAAPTYYYTKIEAMNYKLTGVIPTGSGAYLMSYQDEKYVALALSDSYGMVASGQKTGGQWYDWGYPLVPREQLTPQVLVGLGYGCTNNDCGDDEARSVIWVTPVVDADVYVDFSNSGTFDTNTLRRYRLKQLESIKISDPYDKDMSGAIIWAVKPGKPVDSVETVDIAAAWGQDASVSYAKQSISLDLGTTVLPFADIRVTKLVDKVSIFPGEELLYTIKVSNVGQKHMAAGRLIVTDTLDSAVSYIQHSMTFASPQQTIGSGTIADNTSGTPFPLDGDGYTIPVVLPRRGGTIEISFKVKVAESTEKSQIVNSGLLKVTGSTSIPFDVFSKVKFGEDIMISNTVYLGNDGSGAKCGTSFATKYQDDYIMNNATYCFEVTNNGKTYLKNVHISNNDLDYEYTLTAPLAPGESKILHIERRLHSDLENTVRVIGYPIFPNGNMIPDVDPVEDADKSAVGIYQYTASVSIDNQVYTGHDGVEGCVNAVEKASGILHTPVEYCFTVKNTGNSWLSSLTVTNDVLGSFTKDLDGLLAPGSEVTISLPSSITQNLINVAKVVGNPVNAAGERLVELQPVTDLDPSEVDKIVPRAEVMIENSVYLGHNGAASCSTLDAVEYVVDYYGAAVTYCFKVINTGDTYLDDIDIFDTELSFEDSSLGRLAPKEFGIISYEAKITAPLKNFANVTANPTTEDGVDIEELNDVTAVDPSSVGRKQKQPQILIENTVVLGDYDGKLCGTGAAKEYVEDFKGEYVTYCFLVKNSGDAHLDNIVVNNDDLAFTQVLSRMSPGETKTLHVLSTIDGALTNTVTVQANPVLEDGTDLPGQTDVTDSDTSSVDEVVIDPSVNIENSVYLGSDGGQSCGTGIDKESVEGHFFTPVVYCFVVTNTGNTHLNGIKLTDEMLGYNDDATVISLAPGESKVVPYSGKITDSVENVCTVVAQPITEDGVILPVDLVTDSDPSSVVRVALDSSVSIDNKVYVGNDGGVSCSTASESVTDIYLTNVIYCVEIKNTGETYLNGLVVSNEQLEFTKTVDVTLAPGGSYSFWVNGKIQGDLVNSAVVTGNPSLEDGTDITGVDTVHASDDSEVKKLTLSASISIDNKVYIGDDGIEKCGGSDAVENIEGYYGTNVTYCFKLSNTGESHLAGIEITNQYLYYFNSLNTTLAPGESTMVALPGVIEMSLDNMANVTANPITSDGRDILDLDLVKDFDSSGIKMIPYSPKVTISNTVYSGTDETGNKCGTNDAVDKVTDNYGSGVVYCLEIHNDGDTSLTNLDIFDDKLNFDTSLEDFILAPNESKIIPVLRKITGDEVNYATVTANPVLPDGSDIPYLDHVTDTDSSSVEVAAHMPSIFIEQKIYLGHDGVGDKCGGDEPVKMVEGYPDTNVTVCMFVKNTGDSYLSSIVVDNPKMSFSDSTSIGRLPPGGSKMLFVEGTITATTDNNASVTAQPVLQNGDIIPNTDKVSDQDTTNISMLEYQPNISIDNTIYFGHDGSGQKCGTPEARDYVEGLYGTKITYCLVVTNNGNTHLSHVEIKNDDLSFEKNDIGSLLMGESKTIFVEKQIEQTLQNVAVATGVPVKPNMEIISDLEAVTSEDDSSVGKFVFTGGISVENTVYIGTKDDDKCGTDAAKKSVTAPRSTAVTYCFKIQNTGDTTLSAIKITNIPLDYTKENTDPIPPGGTILIKVSGTIDSDLANTVRVKANPVTDSGEDIPDLDEVTAESSSDVVRLYQASVKIANTVYINDDPDKSCATDGVETVVDFKDTSVVYCFNVTNTGDARLTNLRIHNEELAFSDSSIGNLPPGQWSFVRVNSVITGNVTNTAKVTGIPVTANGDAIPNIAEVSDTDPSEVLTRELVDGQTRSGNKKPYSPPADPDKCMQNNWDDAGGSGELICAAREVYLNSINSEVRSKCMVDETITVTLDASIRLEKSVYDLGWYVAVDGGDALAGTCVVNGLNREDSYAVVDGSGSSASTVGLVDFDDQGDGDACGDVFLTSNAVVGGNIDIPFVVSTTVKCTDVDEDGSLDFAVCFTWRDHDNNDVCNLSKNIPGATTQGCYCSRYNVPNIAVETPGDYVKPC